MAVTETQIVTPQPSVVVDHTQGEQLVYTLTASGATPVFTLADNLGHIIMTSKGVPPKAEYTRTWPISPDDDPIKDDTQHEMIGLMALVTSYTYKVELVRNDGSVKETVINSEYDRVAPLSDTDKFRRGLNVLVLL